MPSTSTVPSVGRRRPAVSSTILGARTVGRVHRGGQSVLRVVHLCDRIPVVGDGLDADDRAEALLAHHRHRLHGESLVQLDQVRTFEGQAGFLFSFRNCEDWPKTHADRVRRYVEDQGLPFNILPILMGATNVWLMHMTPKTGDAMQRRVLMFMPIIFLIFCYNFAAALALYYTVQNLFTILQLWHNQKQPMPVLEKVAPPVTGKKSRKGRS